jgi:hypothetical protein
VVALDAVVGVLVGVVKRVRDKFFDDGLECLCEIGDHLVWFAKCDQRGGEEPVEGAEYASSLVAGVRAEYSAVRPDQAAAGSGIQLLPWRGLRVVIPPPTRNSVRLSLHQDDGDLTGRQVRSGGAGRAVMLRYRTVSSVPGPLRAHHFAGCVRVRCSLGMRCRYCGKPGLGSTCRGGGKFAS